MAKKLKKNSLNNKKVIIGFFDLIHKKHYEMLQSNPNASILTFKNIPKKTNQYYTDKQRFKNLKALGFNDIYVFDVTKNNLDANTFYNQYLKDTKQIIVGSDFKFGNDQKPITEFNEQNINVKQYDNNYSNKLIKELLMLGNINEANQLLNDNFWLEFKVVHGEKLGRKIGFKTANFNIDKLYLKEGVYLTKTTLKNKIYKSISIIGKPKTINKKNHLVIETHILDFDKNIYGKRIKVSFVQYLNELKKFNNKEELINAINNYVNIAKATDY